jgi:hypothetical protein
MIIIGNPTHPHPTRTLTRTQLTLTLIIGPIHRRIGRLLHQIRFILNPEVEPFWLKMPYTMHPGRNGKKFYTHGCTTIETQQNKPSKICFASKNALRFGDVYEISRNPESNSFTFQKLY